MLTNPFYIGRFNWGGQTYEGKHPALISRELFSRVQIILNGGHTSTYGKQEIAFRGLLKCAHDDCKVTGEIKKGKYVYYRGSHGRGPCDLPYFREEQIIEKMGHVLKDVHIPANVAKMIEAGLQRKHVGTRTRLTNDLARLEKALQALHRRVDGAYCDKLDGKISEDFWQSKQADWQKEEWTLKGQISQLEEAKGANPLRMCAEL